MGCLECLMMRKIKHTALSPVERAIAKQKWKQHLTQAHLHTLLGQDTQGMLDRVCTLLFIIGLAAHKANILNPDVKIVHGACRTALDISYAESITNMQRGTIESGLLALERLQPLIDVKYIEEASVYASLLIKNGGVFWHHFEVFIPTPLLNSSTA